MPSFSRTSLYGRFVEIARKQWVTVQANMEKLPDLQNKLSQLSGDDANYFEYSEIDPIEIVSIVPPNTSLKLTLKQRGEFRVFVFRKFWSRIYVSGNQQNFN